MIPSDTLARWRDAIRKRLANVGTIRGSANERAFARNDLKDIADEMHQEYLEALKREVESA